MLNGQAKLFVPFKINLQQIASFVLWVYLKVSYLQVYDLYWTVFWRLLTFRSIAYYGKTPGVYFLLLELMVRADSEMVDYEFNSLFVYFRCFVQDLSTFGAGEGGLEQMRDWTHLTSPRRKKS